MYRMKMDCITIAVSRGTDTPGRPGKVTALDFLYQVKTHRHWDFCFCFLSLVLWDDSTEIMELTSKMKSVYLSQNILATSGFLNLKKRKRKTLLNTVQCKYGCFKWNNNFTYCKIPNFFDPILFLLFLTISPLAIVRYVTTGLSTIQRS